MAFGNGYKAVTTAGTRVQLTTDSSVVNELTVIAQTSNTSQVNVGSVTVVAATGAGERGIPLNAGDSATFRKVRLSDVYIDSRVNGEAVTFFYA